MKGDQILTSAVIQLCIGGAMLLIRGQWWRDTHDEQWDASPWRLAVAACLISLTFVFVDNQAQVRKAIREQKVEVSK